MDGILYIIEGHHRNFGAAVAGKELVPYEVIGEDDEKTYYGGATARERAKSMRQDQLFGHEWLLDKLEQKITGNPKARFSYAEIYPELVERLLNKQEFDR